MGTLDRARYHEQIAQHYRAEIRSGVLPPGAELPATRPLAEAWNVSKKVAGDALALLRDEGWIATRPGKAAIVVGVPDDQP